MTDLLRHALDFVNSHHQEINMILSIGRMGHSLFKKDSTKPSYNLENTRKSNRQKHMIEIVAGLGATKNGLDLIKTVREMLRGPKPDIAKIEEKLGELHERLSDAREGLNDAQDQIRDMKRKLDESDRFKELETDIRYEQDGAFYVRTSEESQGPIPYCPICWGKESKLVPLTPYGYPGQFKCVVHSAHFATEKAKSAHVERERRSQEAMRTPNTK